jgi:hypothetical protein
MKKRTLFIILGMLMVATTLFAGNPVGGKTKSFIAAADYGDTRYVFVELDSARNKVIIVNDTVATAIGVMVTSGESGSAVSVQLDGTCWIKAQQSISKGALVGMNSNGCAITRSSDGERYMGIALEAATAYGDLIEILLLGLREISEP